MRATAPRWSVEGRDWPLRAHSRFIVAAGVRWHVQRLGDGPACLLVHGTGSATHTWRAVAPRLAERFSVMSVDLPGHGFTEPLEDGRMGLEGMAEALAEACSVESVRPRVVVGHSAGAAILAQALLQGAWPDARLVGLAPALWPLPGLAGRVFPPAARWLSRGPLAPTAVAARARDPAVVRQILEGTGTHLDARGVELYARLARRPGHVAGTLAMLARWDLAGLGDRLRSWEAPVRFLVGREDRAVAPGLAARLAAELPDGRCRALDGVGHLVPEEAPDPVIELVSDLG